MRKLIRENKGITLIALIITIIILLILAGVALSLTLGERGIFHIAKKAGENYLNAQDKELTDLEKLYSEIKVAAGEGSQITISIEDLNKIIESKVNNGIQDKVTPLQARVQELETELTQKINNVPRFIDTDKLITTIEGQGASWTATEDCAVSCNLRVTNNAGANVYIDGVIVATLCDQQAKVDGDSRSVHLVYMKEGSTITTRENYGIYKLSVYGLK